MGFHLKQATLVVTGLEFVGFHGVLEAERRWGNRFRIDLELEGDFHRALQTDCLEDSVDYRQIIRTVSDVNRKGCYLLIESFADAIANAVLGRFPKVRAVWIRLTKLEAPGVGQGQCVAIELLKERE
jgi:dihydroneopterin aldolase